MKQTLWLVAGGALMAALSSGCTGRDAGAAGEAAPEASDSVLVLTPEQVASAGIAWGRVESQASGGGIEATAEIVAAPDRVARVGTRVSGRLTELRAGVGDRVGRGQVLGIVDSPELGRAKADYLGALASAHVAAETAERERELFERQISSEREWRQADAEAIRARAERDAAENRLHALGLEDAELEALQTEAHYSSTIALTAPLGGEVVGREASLGQNVEPADVVFTLMDLREVWLLVDVYEKDLREVAVGQGAEVAVAAYPGERFRGTVANVGAILEAQSRAVKVRVVLPNADGRLKPGMFATVRLAGASSGESATGLYVPEGAVQRDGGVPIVFLPAGPGRFRHVRIRTGRERPGWVEVLSGVAAGDSVVTAGAFLLKSELRKSELGEEE